MAAKIAVSDDALEQAVTVDHTKAAECLLGHDHDCLGHAEIGVDEGQAVAFVHQVAHEFQPCPKLATWMQRLEVARGEPLALEQRNGKTVTKRSEERRV